LFSTNPLLENQLFAFLSRYSREKIKTKGGSCMCKLEPTTEPTIETRTRETRNYKQMQEEEGLYRAKSKG